MTNLKVIEIAERKGMEKGKAEGIAFEREETAIRMIEENVEVHFIAKITNLPIERIKKLKTQKSQSN
jgi:predicted transposase YdaD